MANPIDCNGRPLPWSDQPCAPGPVDVSICYAVPPSTTPIPGVKRITLNADCTASASVILDQALAPVPGAVEIGCGNDVGCGCVAADLCLALQSLPTQVPAMADTALFVTPGGCFLGVPGGGGGGFPGYGVPVSTACANAAGVSLLVARADHVHRSALPVQDEGVAVGTRCSLNFIGAGVTAVDNPGLDRVDVTIPGFLGGTITSPILGANGSCAAPTYSFTAAPDSGMFYTGTAVRIGDDNCDDFIEVGASINITSTSGAVTTSAGAAIVESAGTSITRTAAGAITDTGASFSAVSTIGAVSLSAATSILFSTSSTLRLTIQASGAWNIGGSVGTAGQAILSNGPGTPPTWQTVTPAGIGANQTIAVQDAGTTEVINPSTLNFNDGFVVTPAGAVATIDLDYGVPVATAQTNAAGAATTVARSDHVHRTIVQVQDTGVLIGSRPTINFIDGTGITITTVDNGGSDRVDVTIASAVGGFATPTVAADAAAATGGAATTAIRSDAKLQVATGTPVATGTANAAGTATTLARSDHVHLTSFTGMVFSRGATVLAPTAAVNVIVWRAPFACTVTNVRGYRVGGTGATINARRNGTSNHLAAALSLTSADTWIDGGAVSNTAYAAGDKMEIMLVTLSGSPTQIAVQVDLTRA